MPLIPKAIKLLASEADQLSKKACHVLINQGAKRAELVVEKKVKLRYEGTDTAISVVLGSLNNMRQAFQEILVRA